MSGRIRRLYRGETNIQFIATRKRWYLASAIMLVICIASIIVRGFNFGIDFSGGTQFAIPSQGGRITTSQVDTAFADAGVSSAEAAQLVGSGSAETVRVKTGSLDVAEQSKVQRTVAKELHLRQARSTPTVSGPTGDTTSPSRPSRA